MKLTNSQKVFAGIYVAIIAIICCNALFAGPATRQNSTRVSGHFRSLQKETVKGDDSYDLYLEESNDARKISADWAHCFSAQAFLSDVKPGQPVELFLHKSMLPFSPPMVVSIGSAGTNYLNMVCINDDISADRFKVPVTLVVISLLAAAVFALKRKK